MESDRGLKLLLTALPIFTGWLYVIGVANHQAYFSALGAHFSLFNLDVEGALLTGLITIFTWSYPATIYAVLILFMLITALSIAAAVSMNRKPRIFLAKFFKRFRKREISNKAAPQITKIIDGALTLNSFLGAFLSILLLLGLSIVFAANSGKKAAQKDMEDFANNSIHGVKIDGQRSLIIRCSDDFCLVWNGATSTQIPREKLNNVQFLPSQKGGT